jgi:hypothetical protein
MAGVLLRTAAGTLLYVAFLWLVQIDDWRVAGMILTFPMLNGMALLSARENARETGQSMVPVITLNGVMCFLFTLALAWSGAARTYPVALTVLATLLWIAVYAWLEARKIIVPWGAWMAGYVTLGAILSVALTYWLWPGCTDAASRTTLRGDGMAGVLENRIKIGLFAFSLLVVLGVSHIYRDAHAAVGRLGALPVVPLFGLYTVASALASDPVAVPKLETFRSMVLAGWIIALVCVVAFAAYVARTSSVESGPRSGTTGQLVALILGWSLCLAGIAISAKAVPAFAGCAGS